MIFLLLLVSSFSKIVLKSSLKIMRIVRFLDFGLWYRVTREFGEVIICEHPFVENPL